MKNQIRLASLWAMAMILVNCTASSKPENPASAGGTGNGGGGWNVTGRFESDCLEARVMGQRRRIVLISNGAEGSLTTTYFKDTQCSAVASNEELKGRFAGVTRNIYKLNIPLPQVNPSASTSRYYAMDFKDDNTLMISEAGLQAEEMESRPPLIQLKRSVSTPPPPAGANPSSVPAPAAPTPPAGPATPPSPTPAPLRRALDIPTGEFLPETSGPGICPMQIGPTTDPLTGGPALYARAGNPCHISATFICSRLSCDSAGFRFITVLDADHFEFADTYQVPKLRARYYRMGTAPFTTLPTPSTGVAPSSSGSVPPPAPPPPAAPEKTINVCDRGAVTNAILRALAGRTDCALAPEKSVREIHTLVFQTDALANKDLQGLPLQIKGVGFEGSGVRSVPTDFLREFRTLESLEFRDTNVQNLEASAFSGLTSLIAITFKNAGLISIDPATFRNIPRLEILSLSNNRLTEVPTIQLPKLKKLHLDKNQIRILRPQFLAENNSLEEFYMANNPLDTIPAHAFDGVPSLKSLILFFNKIRTIEPEAFVGLRNLERLLLTYNELSEFSPEVAKGMTALKRLDLSENRIQAISPKIAKELPELTLLQLENNPLNKFEPNAWPPRIELIGVEKFGAKSPPPPPVYGKPSNLVSPANVYITTHKCDPKSIRQRATYTVTGARCLNAANGDPNDKIEIVMDGQKMRWTFYRQGQITLTETNHVSIEPTINGQGLCRLRSTYTSLSCNDDRAPCTTLAYIGTNNATRRLEMIVPTERVYLCRGADRSKVEQVLPLE